MNIFALDFDPRTAARYHCDKHVVKMILESAQLLSTAHHVLDGGDLARQNVPGILKPTHVNHPCARWVRDTRGNYEWTWQLMAALCAEHTRRWPGHTHRYAYENGLLGHLHTVPLHIPERPLELFAQAMPDEFQQPDSIQAYRDYYMGAKRAMAQWRAPAEPPPWWR